VYAVWLSCGFHSKNVLSARRHARVRDIVPSVFSTGRFRSYPFIDLGDNAEVTRNRVLANNLGTSQRGRSIFREQRYESRCSGRCLGLISKMTTNNALGHRLPHDLHELSVADFHRKFSIDTPFFVRHHFFVRG